MVDVENSDAHAKMFEAAVASSIIQIYLNGFVVGQSTSDVTMLIQTNGNPSAILNMSFTTAKSLAIELDKVIKNFEKITGHSLLTMEDITTKMVAAKGGATNVAL